MLTYNIHAAKSHFSQLVSEVERGASFIIARNGKPVGLLVPFSKPTTSAPRIGFAVKAGQSPAFDYEAFQAADPQVMALLRAGQLGN